MNIVEDYLVVKRVKGLLHGILWKTYITFSVKKGETQESLYCIYIMAIEMDLQQ